ncbi:DUF5957 family protein [Sporosarcina thermotolerans]|uniref:DUF5957 family protein n=1 Tax=Sporosarcina thermotolerans TaxID=633404 RepID=A0AAW9A6K7_9BACL|nr:DUF5957 family protein [Sporosarcina thermotolerans]MDW0116258.1 DUF5957 family protein [Sporosarcina thermotolerans]WHT48230.1 DUF5957 family protein [Sporosarcina thermotolerans]
MKLLLGILAGIFGGFILGIILSEFIGILGMLIFQKPIGIKFLPFYTAILCTLVVLIYNKK